MFPTMNNNGGLTWPSCETDMCNGHAGQGFDMHYHGDPYGPQCLYSCANYASLAAHPPLIGYGKDGFPIFGRYLSAAAPGASVALDDCGGHIHSGFGGSASSGYVADGVYHYHAFVSNISSLNVAPYAYKAYLYGPYMCYKGDISSTAIPNFFELNANPIARTDYTSGQIKPCTGNANIYLAAGMSLNNLNGSGTNYSAQMSTTYATSGAGSTGGACAALAAVASPPPPPPVPPFPSPPKPPSPSPPVGATSVNTSMVMSSTLSPPPMPASSPSTTCTLGATVACTSNSSSSVTRSLTYSSTTGLFTGSIITNSCPATVTTFAQASGTCAKILFPSALYTSIPATGAAAPITGNVGYTLSGMNIYNPLENGFSSHQRPHRLLHLRLLLLRRHRRGHLHLRALLHLRLLRRRLRRRLRGGHHLWRRLQRPRLALPLPLRRQVRVQPFQHRPRLHRHRPQPAGGGCAGRARHLRRVGVCRHQARA